MMPEKYCFVAMPFRPELNFFYLYIKLHLESAFGLQVERGDSQILTRPLLEKIRTQIIRADFVIAEITGGNPNVFYEIGFAHANDKPTIFLTQDDPEKVPVDVRQFEFIQYSLAKHEEFLERLNRAISSLFGTDHDALYKEACALLSRFNAENALACGRASFEEFQTRLLKASSSNEHRVEEIAVRAQFLLPKIIDNFTDHQIAYVYSRWIDVLLARTV